MTSYWIFIIKSSKSWNILQTSESTSNHLLLLPVLAVDFVPIWVVVEDIYIYIRSDYMYQTYIYHKTSVLSQSQSRVWITLWTNILLTIITIYILTNNCLAKLKKCRMKLCYLLFLNKLQNIFYKYAIVYIFMFKAYISIDI